MVLAMGTYAGFAWHHGQQQWELKIEASRALGAVQSKYYDARRDFRDFLMQDPSWRIRGAGGSGGSFGSNGFEESRSFDFHDDDGRSDNVFQFEIRGFTEMGSDSFDTRVELFWTCVPGFQFLGREFERVLLARGIEFHRTMVSYSLWPMFHQPL